MAKCFPVSVWYNGCMLQPGHALTRERLERDFSKIKELGFNTVRAMVGWEDTETSPGVYNYKEIDLYLEIANKFDLNVLIQLYIEGSPEWVVKMYPDARFEAQSGHVLPALGAPGLCPDHPGHREAAENFMRKIAEHVKDNPAFLGWDVWSEPGAVQWGWRQATLVHPGDLFCYCRYSQDKFRKWLTEKYGTIDILNNNWHKTFTKWSEIELPRSMATWCPASYMDAQLFILRRVVDILEWKVKTIKSVDKEHVATSHIGGPCVAGRREYVGDDWGMAEKVDVWGTSFYPKHAFSEEPRDAVQRGAILDATRSAASAANKPYWIGEFMCGQGVGGLRFAEPVTPEDMKIWTWAVIARGCKGLNYFKWDPIPAGVESTGYGMANFDGTSTPRAEVAGAIAKILDQEKETFLEAQPFRAEVAILYNVYSQLSLAQALGQEVENIPALSLMGFYRALFEKNIPVDFIHVRQVENGELQQYKLLYLPFSITLPEDAYIEIEKFVQNGGTVIADARFGWLKAEDMLRGERIPGFGFDKVFGCQEDTIKSIEKTTISIIANDVALPLLSSGDQLVGAQWKEVLSVNDGRVVAEFEDNLPAIVVNKYGKGKTAFIGTLIGMAYEKFRDTNVPKLIQGFAEWAGVKMPIIIRGDFEDGTLDARILEGNGRKILIVINHTDQEVEADIIVRLAKGEYEMRELTTGRTISGEWENEKLSLMNKFKGNDVLVVEIKSK